MLTFVLRGLAEGLVGKSSVQASNVNEVFALYPVLGSVKEKLAVRGNVIEAYLPCDG